MLHGAFFYEPFLRLNDHSNKQKKFKYISEDEQFCSFSIDIHFSDKFFFTNENGETQELSVVTAPAT